MVLFTRLLLLICISCCICDTKAQAPSGNPPSIKWNQINSGHSRIIMPQGTDSVGLRVANIISTIRTPTQQTIGDKSRKINIVLQNETVVSNGYVGLGPFKSEFYLTPPQNSFQLGSVPWTDMLSMHEYRHVEQYSNFNTGLSHTMRILFGDGGQSLANTAAIPDWFFEGDAVFNETNLSKQGRGSLPGFFAGFKALWSEGKDYSWMKLRNGSYRDFVPDRYPLGYQMVAYGREKYGDEFWKNVTHDAAAYKSLFYPFQKALSKYSGVSYKAFRTGAFNFFKNQTGTVPYVTEEAGYLNQVYPSVLENGNMVYLENSFSRVPAFILKTANSKKVIRQSDYAIDDYFSYRNGKIVYSSYRPDARWSYRNYNEIQFLDITTGRQRRLTKKSRYFSPDISPDGYLVAAVTTDKQMRSRIHILSATSGKLLRQPDNPQEYTYSYPRFISNDTLMTSVADKDGRMSLALLDLKNNTSETLLPFTYNVCALASARNDTLYFTYSYIKSNDLFAVTLADKKIWQVTAPPQYGFGKYHVSLNDSIIAWHSFTAEGNKIRTGLRSNLAFAEVPPEKLQVNLSVLGVNSLHALNSNLLYSVSDDSFPIRKYPKSHGLLAFHSLIPEANDPVYSLTAISENILNTLQTNVSIAYDRSEKYKKAGVSASYSQFFPIISAGANYRVDRRTYYRNNPLYFNQFETYAGISVPLDLSRGRSFIYLNGGSQYVHSHNRYTGNYKDSLAAFSYGYLNNYINASHQIQKAQQQIFPRFAQSLNAGFKTPLSRFEGSQLMVNGNLYFPGLWKNHSVVINGATLVKDTLNQISFTSGFPFSRGYEAANFHRMFKAGISYHLPLFYPDAGVANIAYLLRVRANIFYDHTKISDFNRDKTELSLLFRSVGTEITFDTKWWNQLPVSFGFRYSYLLDTDLFNTPGRNRWEIILPVNLLQQ